MAGGKLLVVSPGLSIRLRQGVVEIRDLGDRSSLIEKLPLASLDAIIISSRSGLVSTTLLYEAARHGIPIYIVDSKGRAVSSVLPAEPTRNSMGSIAQALWRVDPARRISAAKWFVEWKVRNRAWLLKRLSRSYGTEMREIAYLMEGKLLMLNDVADVSDILSVEAQLGRLYWDTLVRYTPLGESSFKGRIPRGGDPWNSSLDYLYSLLRSLALSALIFAGLNPYMGFLHRERSGKQSLVYDYMEPYRYMVEWIIIKLARAKFNPKLENNLLSDSSRKTLLDAWIRWLEKEIPGTGRSYEDAIRLDAWKLREALIDGVKWVPTYPVKW